jgi:hypothetical protein
MFECSPDNHHRNGNQNKKQNDKIFHGDSKSNVRRVQEK